MTGPVKRAVARWPLCGGWIAGCVLALGAWVSMGGPLW